MSGPGESMLIDWTMLTHELWGPTAIFGTIRSDKRCIWSVWVQVCKHVVRFIELIKCELVVCFIELIDRSMNHNSFGWPSMKGPEPWVFFLAVVMLWQPCQPAAVLLVIIGLAHRALAHRALSKSYEHRKIVSSGVYVLLFSPRLGPQ